MRPRYLFADGPTGNLDSSNAKIVMDISKRVNKKGGTSIVFVTHDNDFANSADRKIILSDGQLLN